MILDSSNLISFLLFIVSVTTDAREKTKKDGILEYAITCGHHFPFPASSKNSHFFQLIFLPVLPLSYNDKCPVELCTIHQNTHQPTECLLLMGLKIIPLWISKCHSLPYQCDANQTQRRFNSLQTHTHIYIFTHVLQASFPGKGVLT